MKSRWEATMKRARNVFDINLDPGITNVIYEYSIVPAYTKERHYHTLKHIKHMLIYLHDFELTLIERTKLELAIWFHDVVYDSRNKDNEVRSAEKFAGFAKHAGFKQSIFDEIISLILITKHVDSPRNRLEEIICDCDLKELATDNWKKNSENVRKEYAFLSDDEWKEGRSEFLMSMLSKEHIFHTDTYKGILEDAARINIQKELDTLTL